MENFILAADSNKDGKVTKTEYDTAVEKVVAGGIANAPGKKRENKKQKI